MKKTKLDKKTEKDFFLLAIHKLKTPLSSVKLCLEMLLSGDFGELNNQQKEIIEKARQKNNALIDLVGDLINAAKVESKTHSHNFVFVNFENMVESVVKSLQEKIQSKKIILKIEKPQLPLPKIMADKEEIFMAIQNVFDNAVKYNKEGGEINVFLGSNGKNLELKIQDQGPGIPESEKENLFTKFFMGKNTSKTQGESSGLGLYISKGIIENHCGKIWFESKENEGSTFFVTLPIR